MAGKHISDALPPQEKDYTIRPGIGVGHLRLGMTEQEVLDILGKPQYTYTPEQSQKIHESVGYNIAALVKFDYGFDIEWQYETEPPMPYPVFKVYFLGGKLNHIILSAYVHASSSNVDKVHIDNQLHFMDNEEVISAAFADKWYYFRSIGDNYDGEYLYLGDGVNFILDEEKIRVIAIYSPMEGHNLASFQDALDIETIA